MVDQVTSPVRWVEIMQFLISQGEMEAIEFGPGKVLRGLARRIDRKFKVHVTENVQVMTETMDLVRQS